MQNVHPPALPSFDQLLRQVEAAEEHDGWLLLCEQRGCYLALNRELIAALAATLRAFDTVPILEVCAGDGRLAAALAAADTTLIATDSAPSVGSPARPMSALEALARYQPHAVLGSFVPLDSDVDRAVLGTESVRHYLVLNARVGGSFGSSALWNTSGWHARPLEEITRWMITRHDVWLADPGRKMIQHGEAWLLSRGES